VQAIRDGAVGIGFGINYTPGASYEEIFALFEVAAAEGVPCHLHARYKGNVFPLTMSLATMEVISMAAASGAQAQLAHLISSTVGSAPLSIALIEGAAARGVDVGFDFHVWTRNQTWLQSALFDEGWQENFGGATYSDIYVADTQEQLTEERFFELRAQREPLSVQTEFIPEEEMIMGLRSPLGIVSSDGGGLVDGRGHPRSTGTFGRFLGRFVRDLEVVDWMEGIRKITLLPAQRLERAVPAMERKGRLQIGMDADLTVFDPASVRERATYSDPARMTEGISYVVVNGIVVLDDGEIVEGAEPGRWLRHPRPTLGALTSAAIRRPSMQTGTNAGLTSGFRFGPQLLTLRVCILPANTFVFSWLNMLPGILNENRGAITVPSSAISNNRSGGYLPAMLIESLLQNSLIQFKSSLSHAISIRALRAISRNSSFRPASWPSTSMAAVSRSSS
jgi:hypothetical protein